MNKAEGIADEGRSEARTFLDEYRSVEFSISRQYPAFQFRIRDVSSSGMGILINKGLKSTCLFKGGAGS